METSGTQIASMKNKVLICDDDKDIVEMLTIAVGGGATEVMGITNSMKLFATIEEFNPDILLLDIWMPELAGDIAIQTIRKTARYSKLPVIMMSASRDGKKIAMAAGATQFISKPFDISLIRQLISDCLAIPK